MNDDSAPAPHMDEQGLACFKDIIGRSRCFLEYGSGASTIHAHNVARVRFTISVETDRQWASKVADSLDKNGSTALITHCDVGPVGEWGMPVSREGMDRYWRYMTAPWDIARQRGWIPDIILIDGRFRVASFLFSLISARVGTTILFDDYLNRPAYGLVEEFCRLESRHGRMGLFIARHDYSTVEITRRIAQYSVIAR